MLKQVTTHKKTLPVRQWFSDEDHDLFIWLDSTLQPIGFQFTYDKLFDEHCLSWMMNRGYSHDRIDTGEDVYLNIKQTPVMVADGEFNAAELAKRLSAISDEVPEKLLQFVLDKIHGYATS